MASGAGAGAGEGAGVEAVVVETETTKRAVGRTTMRWTTADATEMIRTGMNAIRFEAVAEAPWLNGNGRETWLGRPAGQPAMKMGKSRRKQRSLPSSRRCEMRARSSLSIQLPVGGLANGRGSGDPPWLRSCRAVSMLQFPSPIQRCVNSASCCGRTSSNGYRRLREIATWASSELTIKHPRRSDGMARRCQRREGWSPWSPGRLRQNGPLFP
mmetsp:Transcript_41453/g.96840  ORF Transcript_41453/g.96840 Transcript_41453/m.96840 type:complete len:213 (+) Transcript_41453:1050-1688(+)